MKHMSKNMSHATTSKGARGTKLMVETGRDTSGAGKKSKDLLKKDCNDTGLSRSVSSGSVPSM